MPEAPSSESQQPASTQPQDAEPERVQVKLENEDLDSAIVTANERKQSGNDEFRSGKWEAAMASYEAALNALPRRKQVVKQPARNMDEDVVEDEDSLDPPTVSSKGKEKEKEEAEEVEEEEEQEEVVSPEVKAQNDKCAQLRAVLNANIGACYVKMGDHKQAVESCTEALKDDPLYIKALERRASSNDALNTWSSLTAVKDDYEKLLTIPSLPASQRSTITRKLQVLKPRLEEAQKHETAEMVDKLKGLGNSILGKFGLSTDNFKFEPNGQGGYAMNFVR